MKRRPHPSVDPHAKHRAYKLRRKKDLNREEAAWLKEYDRSRARPVGSPSPVPAPPAATATAIPPPPSVVPPAQLETPTTAGATAGASAGPAIESGAVSPPEPDPEEYWEPPPDDDWSPPEDAEKEEPEKKYGEDPPGDGWLAIGAAVAGTLKGLSDATVAVGGLSIGAVVDEQVSAVVRGARARGVKMPEGMAEDGVWWGIVAGACARAGQHYLGAVAATPMTDLILVFAAATAEVACNVQAKRKRAGKSATTTAAARPAPDGAAPRPPAEAALVAARSPQDAMVGDVP